MDGYKCWRVSRSQFGCFKISLLEFLEVLSVGIISKNFRVPKSQWLSEILEQEIGVHISLRIFWS